MADVNTYASEMIRKFIIGTEPLSNFNNYLNQINSYGFQEAIKLTQAAYDRYLEQCYDNVDQVAIHHYYTVPEGNVDALLNSSAAIEDFIKTTLASCDFMKTKLKSRKTMMVAFDEYGVHAGREAEPVYWYDGRRENTMEFNNDFMTRPFTRYDGCEYNTEAPRRGAMSEMLQTISLNAIAMTLLRHADRVKVGCFVPFIQRALGIDQYHVHKTALYYAYEQLNQQPRPSGRGC
jgi:alpha-N-arabinofuranosidase